MTENAVASIGMNGTGVAIELNLDLSDGGVRRWVGECPHWCQKHCGERCFYVGGGGDHHCFGTTMVLTKEDGRKDLVLLLMSSRVETDEVLDYAIIRLVLCGSPPTVLERNPNVR
jgi:hypothetical protein